MTNPSNNKTLLFYCITTTTNSHDNNKRNELQSKDSHATDASSLGQKLGFPLESESGRIPVGQVCTLVKKYLVDCLD
jgi:hypothetical protein